MPLCLNFELEWSSMNIKSRPKLLGGSGRPAGASGFDVRCFRIKVFCVRPLAGGGYLFCAWGEEELVLQSIVIDGSSRTYCSGVRRVFSQNSVYAIWTKFGRQSLPEFDFSVLDL